MWRGGYFIRCQKKPEPSRGVQYLWGGTFFGQGALYGGVVTRKPNRVVMLVNHQGVRNSRGPRRPNTVACDKQHGPETKVTMEEEHLGIVWWKRENSTPTAISAAKQKQTWSEKTRILEANKKTQSCHLTKGEFKKPRKQCFKMYAEDSQTRKLDCVDGLIALEGVREGRRALRSDRA